MTYKADEGAPFTSVVPIRRVVVAPVVRSVRARYEETYGSDPEDRGGWYHEDDWNRISFVLAALQTGGSVLDIGLGAGQFVNALALSGRFTEVHGSDPTRFRKYMELSDDIRRIDKSVAELPYADGQFGVVTCMEVLEHVDDDIFVPALSELRRVCRGQLLMTVPFNEPEPISKTHQRRFETPDLLKWFPDAEFVLMDRPRMPWALIEEWPKGRPPGQVSPMRLAAVEGAVAGLQWETRWLRNKVAKLEPGGGVRSTAHRIVGRAKHAAGRARRRLVR